MNTYVTLLSTVEYLPGVLALHEALRRVRSAYPLLVACSRAIFPAVEPVLKQAGMRVTALPRAFEIPKQIRDGSGHWGHTFDKLHLFGLTAFDKLVYVDSDMIVLANIDELFDKPHMSAVAAGRLLYPDWTRLNSGLMVIEPAQNLPGEIVSTLQKALGETSARKVKALGDQDLINAFYSTWPDTEALHLDQGYNVFQTHLDAYIESHNHHLAESNQGRPGQAVKIVHFIGPVKPWMKGAYLRHQLDTLRRGKSARWERHAFAAYRKLLADTAQPTLRLNSAQPALP